MIPKEELLTSQGCKLDISPGHVVGPCWGAWGGSAGSGRPGPGPAAGTETVIPFLTQANWAVPPLAIIYISLFLLEINRSCDMQNVFMLVCPH